ncbi:DUF2059 domain-containing protein [Sphingomonas sp. CJ20]
MRLAIAAAALAMPAVAAAQTAPVVTVVVPPAPIEPARLAVAQRVVAKLLPAGIYKRMLGENFRKMMERMMGAAGDMPLKQVVRLTGVDEAEASKLGDGTLGEVMAIYDPHWQDRTNRMMDLFTALMTDLGTEMEPSLREAMSRAYAREFTAAELAEMDRFFTTPAGAHYADQSMALSMDPEMVEAMQKMVPTMMERMPAIVEKMQVTEKDFPPARKNKDLTPAERAKVARLLGVDPKTLETQGEDE